MLQRALVLCAILGVAFAWQALGPHEPKPEEFQGQEGCYVADLGRVLGFGETAPAKTQGVHGVKCQQYRCSEAHLVYTGCGAVAAPADCELVTDESKPYPGCCPQIKC